MFPQSELDNYKLQVELLQEKLQRSEISRQQLEHKLDKILQKRDELDKTVRSKARQKYQTFLEEQQRRNERNKQLVQMLERIEQQTEAMNARSERLKMMKLQYEMYFAKLVHSQTRRCIQDTVAPVTPMMATTSAQSMVPSGPTTVIEGYNYMPVKETQPTLISNSYPSYAMPTNIEREQILRSQTENMPLETMQTMPTLANFVRTERNEQMDFRNLNMLPVMQNQQQPYQYPTKYAPIANNVDISNNPEHMKQETIMNSTASPIVNTSNTLSSATNLLPQDKQLADYKEPSNLSTTTTSSTFEEIPNVRMRPDMTQNSRELANTTTLATKPQNAANNPVTRLANENLQALQIKAQLANNSNLIATNQIDNSTNISHNHNQNVNTVKPTTQVKQEIKTPAVNNLKPQDVVVPKLIDKPSTSLVLEPTKTEIELSSSSYNTNYVNKQPETNEHNNIANASLTPTIAESNSSTTPVSIENIENAIYGELLSPLETEEVQNPDNSNVVPKLLENLVTQAENIESENITLDETALNQVTAADNNLANDTPLADVQESETQNYDQTGTYDEYNNAQPMTDETANTVAAADYNNYENVDNTAIDEGQQQQQYDYTNYDPTQYSYPGYIYDETTGEYKPDPNAPAEQYATDQQYTTEGYDQQYQQQEVYDYNQTYAQEPTTASETAENIAYNNYETTPQDNNASNDTQADTNNEQQQPIAEPEPIAITPEDTAEEVAQPSSKVTKPTSILSTTDKNDTQKKKKRVNFVDSSETDDSAVAGDKGAVSTTKPVAGNAAASSESDFDFSSSTEAEAKAT